MDYRLHRSIDESPYNQQHHREGYDDDEEEQFMMRDQPLPSISTASSSSAEVSVQNPTQLFQFMNRHLWAQAMKHLQLHPADASVWITSSTQKNLPLHLACLMLSSSSRGAPPPPPLHFIEALVKAYPSAAAEKNNEGRLPLHLASECIDMTSRYLESEGILLLLSKIYPAGLKERDGEGRLPLQILEERGVSAFAGKLSKSGVIRYMKSQTKTRSKKSLEHAVDATSDGFVTPKKAVGTPNSDRGYGESRSTPMSDRYRDANQAPSPTPYRGYDLLSTPAVNAHAATNNGYDLISTPAHNSSPSPQVNISHSYPNDTRDATNAYYPSEYVLLSPPRVALSPRSNVVVSNSTPPHNNTLEAKLQLLEAQYAQLQSNYDSLSAIHSGTVSELKEQTKRAEEGQYKINVLSESEDSRIRLNSELKAKYAQLQTDFDNLNAVHSRKVSALLEQTNQNEESQIRLNKELKESKIELESKLSHQMRVNAELKGELNERTKQLQEMRTRESSLLQQLLKKLQNDEERLNEEKVTAATKERDVVAKNILLREVAMKAIETVGKLSAMGSSDASSKSGLQQLLEDADLPSTTTKVSSTQRDRHLKANDALKMLQPIIDDAQNMQTDIISKVHKLSQACKTTSRLIDGISTSPQRDFDFEETLQSLGEVMSTNIGLLQSLDTSLVNVEKILNNVATVTKQSTAVADVVTRASKGDENLKALHVVVEITQKTSKKLESLAKTIAQLNFSEVNLKKDDMKKYVKTADEITKVFQLSLDHLTKDTNKIRGIADAAINANKLL